MIEEAEYVLRDLGFYDVRVRHHELPMPDFSGLGGVGGAVKSEGGKGEAGKAPRALARIEVGVEEMPKLLVGEAYGQVAEALKGIGYAHVTLDLQGYRRGSLNERVG